jgi:anti-sigma B factor antagonist
MHRAALQLRDTDHHQGEHVVEAQGEIDLSTRSLFADHLAELIREGTRRLLIDLSGVKFMDSSGLGVLLKVRRDLGGEGSSLRLVVSADLRQIFELTGLDRHFELVDIPVQAEPTRCGENSV